MSLLERMIQWAGYNWDVSTKKVGVKDALGVPPAWYAHNKLTGDFARLPIDVKRVQGEGAVKIQSPTVFKAQLLSHALLKGNGRAAIIRNGSSIDELIPMMPEQTWSIVYEGEKYHVYKPDDQTKKELFDAYDTDDNGYLVFHDSIVLHINGFSYDGVEGLGLLDLANVTFGNSKEAVKFQNNQIQKGFRGKLFLEAPPGMLRKENEAQDFIDAFNAKEAGSDNAGKAGLLREGVKANAVSMSNSDAQFVELQKFNRQDIGMLFGLEGMPGDGETNSYASREQNALAYLQCLDRWLVQFEEQCDMKLRTDSEKRLGRIYFKFNTAAILRTDLKSTIDAFSIAISSRIMNPNECRAKLDLNPYIGGDEFINPNIQQANGESSQGENEDDPADDEDEASEEEDESDDSPTNNARAVEVMLRDLIKTEGNNAINAAGKGQFVAWIGKNYAKWQSKLADKVEAIGLDRDSARIHCEESARQLAELAAKHGPKDLQNAVRNTVETWGNRAILLQKGAK
jgi:HK97 family phage portal protein